MSANGVFDTAVGTSARARCSRRARRPLAVAYQDAPERALPDALKESNPLGIPRRVDGVYEVPAS
ncbi:hypothetical protein [Agreia sp. PsM10]|uniref:hypothetical protein n=1 Tax=Agreia sp. PsM10 TaxID=3030533 RepID=UPI00263BD952|nr:hypothetical protein [Agreia sp. PsM10]